MSGFERSAPIPGSQGPRRSQMVRFNNAPPPLTPWRAEVLEAQRQLEAAKRSASRSRSRARRAKDRDRDKGGKGAEAQAPSRRPDASAVAPETGVVLRQARERGEGWYAAVARAAESWDTVHAMKKHKKGADGQAEDGQAVQGKKSAKEMGRLKKKDKDAGAGEKGAEAGKPRRGEDGQLERHRREEQDENSKVEDERAEQERQRIEFEARAEERRVRADEERRKAEEERKRSEALKKQRQERLKGAFAVGGDDPEEDEDRQAQAVRRAAERKRAQLAEAPLGVTISHAVGGPLLGAAAAGAAAATGSTSLALLPKGPRAPVDPDLSEKLRFEPGLNPAEAFMRLQERKRKGRRAEFGGPPRGCSPWRDGKRGVTFEKGEEEA